jgi:hypothetical protein
MARGTAKSKAIINDRPWQQFRMRVDKVANMRVNVGVLASKGGNAPVEGGPPGFDLVALAATHEYGSSDGHVPERSYLRRTFSMKQEVFAAASAKVARGYLAGKIDLEKAGNLLGAVGATEVKKTITEGDGVPPPLAASTISRKGSSRPLVDTGRLLNAITWEVFLA